MPDETKEAMLVVAIAKRIQWIEHGGRHSWESCIPTARIRAIEQAKACIDEIARFGAAVIYAEDKQVNDTDKTIAILSRAVHSMAILMDESHGVAGLHKNGDVATWGELLRGGRFESWLEDVSYALDELNKAATENSP